MRLEEDWKSAWRWFSMQAMALNVGFLATWAMLPTEFKEAMPSWFMPAVAIGLLLTGMIGRLMQQKPSEKN